MQKYLFICQKSSNFARFFAKNAIRMVPSGHKPAERLWTEERDHPSTYYQNEILVHVRG